MTERSFNFNASPEIFRRAKELRQQMTNSEMILWERLRAGRLNSLKFRRLHPIDQFIVDFYCHSYKLVIELDGSIYNDLDQKMRDLGREETLKSFGIEIIRFKNEEVEKEINYVLQRILLVIEELR
jgi:very-short-patch-repair endonuclease